MSNTPAATPDDISHCLLRVWESCNVFILMQRGLCTLQRFLGNPTRGLEHCLARRRPDMGRTPTLPDRSDSVKSWLLFTYCLFTSSP